MWPTRKRYKLNRLLVRLAAEDGAQQATRIEIARQLKEQGLPNMVVDCNWDIKMVEGDCTVEGKPVEWIEGME